MRTILLLLVAWVPAANAFLVAFCGQEVPPGETSYMRDDLACGGGFESRISVARKARLVMGGHRLTVRRPDIGQAAIGIICPNGCTIEGPGTIVGPGDGQDGMAILQERGRLTATDVDISGFNDGVLVFPQGRMTATRVTVHDCSRTGIVAGKLSATDVTVRDVAGGTGISSLGQVKGVGIIATGNHTGIQASRSVKTSNAVVTGNGSFGIVSTSIKLRDSTVTGNGVFDLSSTRRPQLVNTTCERSTDENMLGSWGVCSLD
jgi:hypothetical protein